MSVKAAWNFAFRLCICRTGSCFNVHRHTTTVAVKGLLKMSKVDCCALKWARFSLAAQSAPVRTSARASLILLLLRLLFQLTALKRATHLFYFEFVPCNDCFSVLGCQVTKHKHVIIGISSRRTFQNPTSPLALQCGFSWITHRQCTSKTNFLESPVPRCFSVASEFFYDIMMHNYGWSGVGWVLQYSIVYVVKYLREISFQICL